MTVGAAGLAELLASRFGAKAVLCAAADVEPALSDGTYTAHNTRVVVFRPATADELSQGLALLGRSGVAVVPRGGGSGLAGGAVPPDDRLSVVVSTERMRRIRGLDRKSRVMVAEAGVVLAAAQAAAAEAGFSLGLDHGGAGSATVGGSIATNAGGIRVIKNGMARDQLLGVEAVLVDGRIIGGPRGLWKDNSGINLAQLLAGSEGTLAIITACALKLRPAARGAEAMLLGVADPAAAVSVLESACRILGEAVSAAELISASAIDWAEGQGHAGPPFAAPWYLLIGAEATSPYFDLTAGIAALLCEVLGAKLALDGVQAQSAAQRNALWSLREGIPEAMGAWRGAIGKTDTAVPPAAVPAFVARIEAATPPEALAAFFGHVGDGNIHVNFLPRPGQERAFELALPHLMLETEEAALALGGTVSAEHGIGRDKRAALTRMRSAVELELMAGLKRVFDPGDRLNPGKILIPASEKG